MELHSLYIRYLAVGANKHVEKWSSLFAADYARLHKAFGAKLKRQNDVADAARDVECQSVATVGPEPALGRNGNRYVCNRMPPDAQRQLALMKIVVSDRRPDEQCK